MNKADMCKFRIQDYARERDSLRGLEWKTYFQLYVGYAAIVAAFTYLIDHAHSGTEAHVVGLSAAVFTLAVWAIEVNLLRAIHDRQRVSSDLKRAYFSMLHSIVGLKELRERDTLFGRQWGTVPQFILGCITTLVLVVYEIWRAFAGGTPVSPVSLPFEF